MKNLVPCLVLMSFWLAGGTEARPPGTKGPRQTKDPLIPAVIGEKWGYVRAPKRTQFVIAPQYDLAGRFSEGLAWVKRGGKFGYIDAGGREVIAPRFQQAGSFTEGLAAVKIGDKFGYIDPEGQIVIRPQYDFAQPFADGLAAVKVGGRYGYINRAGETVISPQFQTASRFSQGLAAVRQGGEFGYINPKGKFVVRPQFQFAGEFRRDLAPVKVEGKFGYIDKTGREIIAPRFDLASPFEGNAAVAGQGKKVGYLKPSGQWEREPEFDHLEPLKVGNRAVKGKTTYVIGTKPPAKGKKGEGPPAFTLTPLPADANQYVSVRFETKPAGAKVYSIPTPIFEEWKEDLDALPSKWEYFVNTSPTNCDYPLDRLMNYWIIFEHNQQRQQRFCRPVQDKIIKAEFR
jgi:hypothetical protein